MSRLLKGRLDSSVAEKLIDAAEQLYGEHGIQGVSLRQISAAAGTGNNYAVQYHFGDVDGLIRAIIENRLPSVEMERAERLARVVGQGPLKTWTLLDVLTRPIIDRLDNRGRRSLARFILAFLTNPGEIKRLIGYAHLMPITSRIFELLYAANPDIPPLLLAERVRLASLMVLTSVFNRLEPFDDSCDADLINNALDMAAAAIAAPVGDSLRARSHEFAAGSNQVSVTRRSTD